MPLSCSEQCESPQYLVELTAAVDSGRRCVQVR